MEVQLNNSKTTTMDIYTAISVRIAKNAERIASITEVKKMHAECGVKDFGPHDRRIAFRLKMRKMLFYALEQAVRDNAVKAIAA